MDGDRQLDGRAGLRGSRDGAADDGGGYLRFDSFDSDYYNGWDLKSAMHPQTILAYAHNDQPL